MSSGKPKVSMGLPVYNGEAYLPQALDSLLGQSYTDFELVICDNASTDSTQEICERYAAQDSRIRYYRNAENIGASNNHNRAFELSVGEYFKWVSDDDIYLPTYLERVVAVLDSDPSVVVCHTHTTMVDSTGQEIDVSQQHRGFITDSSGNVLGMRDPESANKGLDSKWVNMRLRGIVLLTGWVHEIFGLMRRSVLAQTPLMGHYYGSDKVLLAEMAVRGRFVVLPEALFINRRHIEQSGNIFSAQMREIWNNPRTKKKISARWECFKGYVRAATTARMSLQERIGSLFVIAIYVGNVRRWLNVWEESRGYPNLRPAQPIGTGATPESPASSSGATAPTSPATPVAQGTEAKS